MLIQNAANLPSENVCHTNFNKTKRFNPNFISIIISILNLIVIKYNNYASSTCLYEQKYKLYLKIKTQLTICTLLYANRTRRIKVECNDTDTSLECVFTFFQTEYTVTQSCDSIVGSYYNFKITNSYVVREYINNKIIVWLMGCHTRIRCHRLIINHGIT